MDVNRSAVKEQGQTVLCTQFKIPEKQNRNKESDQSGLKLLFLTWCNSSQVNWPTHTNKPNRHNDGCTVHLGRCFPSFKSYSQQETKVRCFSVNGLQSASPSE